MPKVKTIKIKHGDDYAVINETDFVEGEHLRFEEKKQTSKKPQTKKVTTKKD